MWQHRSSGYLATWTMQGLRQLWGTYLSPAFVTDPAWKIAAAADVSRDADLDLLWQHDEGAVSFWIMSRGRVIRAELLPRQMPNPDWRAAALADLNSDGMADVIWRNRSTGAIEAWLLNPGSPKKPDATIALSTPRGSDWQLAGAADFDGDAQTDLLWQNEATGDLEVSRLAWTGDFAWTESATIPLGPGRVDDTDWKIRGVADMNLDGFADLIWQHRSSGLIAGWLMFGTDLHAGALLSPGQVEDTDWIIRGPR